MYSMQRSCSSQQFMSNASSKHSAFSTSNGSGGNGGGADPLQRSSSISNCTIVNKRGFKPSDRFDPAKKEFLLGLSKQIWQRDTPNPGHKKTVDLQKIFTPADDAPVILPQKNRKLYASSAFFAPGFHPTVEDQVELARMISSSLYDSSNVQSKGQSMYVNRKKRSVKWVHEGNDGTAIEYEDDDEDIELASPVQQPQTQVQPPPMRTSPQKLPIKLVMDPRGVTKDFETAQNQSDIQKTPIMASEKCNELMSALMDTGEKGAEIFAKRRKCSDENQIVANKDESASVAASQVASASFVSQNCVKSQEVVNTSHTTTSSVESKSISESNQSVVKTECQSNSIQPVTLPIQQDLPIYLLETLPLTVKRPKGWKPVCPNLPKLKTPPGLYTNISNYSAANSSLTTQSVAQQSQLESIQTSATEKVVEEVKTSISTAISTTVDEQHLQHLQQTFVNCLAKSPELIKSDAREHFIDYDSTVTELKTNIEQCAPQQAPPSPKDVATSSSNRQSPLALSPSSQKVKPKPTVQPVFAARSSTPVPVNAQPAQEPEEPESYKTIPVRDLISTFEKQSQPALRYNIREDLFPAQILQKSANAATVAEPKPQPEKSLSPPSTLQVQLPPIAKTEVAELPTISVEPEIHRVQEIHGSCSNELVAETNSTSAIASTDDALVQEINTFNEVAAEFSASITSTTAADFQVSDKSQALTFDELVTPSPTAYFRAPHIQPDASLPAAPPAPVNHFSPPHQSPAPFAPFSPQPPVSHYQPPPQPLWQASQRPLSQNTFTPTLAAESPTRQSATTPNAAARRSPLDLDKLQNYNRAASGWGQSKGFYRPVTFNKPKVVLAYSDF